MGRLQIIQMRISSLNREVSDRSKISHVCHDSGLGGASGSGELSSYPGRRGRGSFKKSSGVSMEKSRAPPAVGGRGAGSLAVYDQQLFRSSCPSGSGANPTSSVGPKSPSKSASDARPCGCPCQHLLQFGRCCPRESGSSQCNAESPVHYFYAWLDQYFPKLYMRLPLLNLGKLKDYVPEMLAIENIEAGKFDAKIARLFICHPKSFTWRPYKHGI